MEGVVATAVEIRRFLNIPGSGSGDGYGSGSGSGYGDSSGDGSGDGYGSGSGDGDSSGDGYGSGSGYGSGDGYGYGSGSGYGDNSGDGYGSGSGSGYGDGYGYGSGSGSGYGDGYGSGSGSGYGDGKGDLKKFEGDDVYYIDNIPSIILSIHQNIAKVAVVVEDFSLKSVYVAKFGRSFAHGETPREAVEAATQKDMEDRPVEERIDLFVQSHPDLDTPYPDLFGWHHTLTGSCKFGRREWCKAHGYQPTDSITVRTFLEQTKNDYGGDAIRLLAVRYGIKD